MLEGAVGMPGAGKTYYGVRRGLRAIKQGRPVFANFDLLGSKEITLKDLIEHKILPNALVIWDEAHLDFSSRNWKEFGDDLTRFFSQTRKIEITLLWICQDVSTIDKIIRDRTHLIHDVKSGGSGFFSPAPLYFSVKSYYGAKNLGKEKFQAGVSFYRFKKDVADSYNTHELLLGDRSI